MSSVIVQGDTSGSITLSAPAVSGSSVLTLPVATDTLVGKATTDTLTNKTLTAPAISSAVLTTMASSVITSGTAQASTSGTSIDFTGIPSWVKRITVMFNGVSTNGTSNIQVQLGAGSVTTTGYLGIFDVQNGSVNGNLSAGFVINPAAAAGAIIHGRVECVLLGSNIWCCVAQTGRSDITGTGASYYCSGSLTLGGTLDRVRITTVNGTDTFDAGSINILFE